MRHRFRRLEIEELEGRYLLSISGPGSNFVVNSAATSTHANAAVGENASGQFVIAWSSLDQVSGSSGEDVYATRYDANGNALDVPGKPAGTKEFLVNTFTTNNQDHPAVAVAADGSFVVVWDSVQVGSLLSIHGQRFNSSGSPVGSEFEVNTYTAHSTNGPTIAMAPDGEFVVAWTSYAEDAAGTDGVYAQLYNADGSKLGGEFPVNTTTIDDQQNPAAAMDSAGDFVIAWQSDQGDGSTYDVYARQYNSAGAAQGGEFQVNTYTPSNQRYPTVAMDSAGNFVVAWTSSGEDGSSDGIYAQRYNSAGVAQGTEFLVNTSYTSSNQQFAAIAMDSAGAFAIAWQSSGENGVGSGIFGIDLQQYSAAGNQIGGEISVSNPGQSQTLPALGIDVNGGLVVAWQGVQSDGVTTDIVAEHDPPAPTPDSYSTSIGQPLAVNAAAGVLSNDGFVGTPVTALLVTNPSQGSVTLNSDGSFAYTPNSGFAGTDTFTYEAQIGQQLSAPATVTIAVVDSSSLATIAGRLLAYASAGASSDPAKVSGILAKMNSDGSFIGYDYSGTTSTSATDYEQQAEYLTTLANAYQYNSPTNTWYQSAALLADIVTSFNYLANTAVGDANLPNWYDTQIAMPNDLWPAMVLVQNQLGSTLTAALLTKYFDSASRPVWNLADTSGENHGSNLTMRATAAVAEGALEGNAVSFTIRLAQVVTLVSADLTGGSPAGDGLQVDDSEHQHDGTPVMVAQLQSGSYGVDYATSLAQLLPWLNATSYQFSTATDDLVVGYVLDGEQWMMRGDTFEATSMGRSITRPGDSISVEAAHLLTATTGLMALGIRVPELQAFSTSLSTGVPEALSGNRAFWTSDFMVQQRPGYMASVRMISDRTIRPETLNGEGLQSFYLGDGVTMIYVTGDEYGATSGQEIYPAWNWQRLPGTTIEQAATIPTSVEWDTNDASTVAQYAGLGSFVGSDSDGTYGLAAMDYGRAVVNVTAHKSWFYFDEGFVALGADINDSAGSGEVDTTLNQSLLTSNVTVEQSNGTQTTFGNGTTMNLVNPNWILQAGIGYVLLGGNGNVVVQAQPQTGTWQSIGASTGSVTDNVFTAYIDQGVNPQNASYAYAVLPGATVAGLDTYVGSNAPLTVLSNTDAIQAVQEASEGVTEIAFYQAGSLAIGNNQTVTVDEPCLVTVRQSGGGNLEVSVSDPTQSLSTVHVQIVGHFGGTGAAWQSSQDATQLTVALPSGSDAGESVVIPLTNLAPMLTPSASTATFIRGGSAVAIAPSVSIADAGSANLQSASVTILNLLDGSAEALAVPGTASGGLVPGTNITVNYSSATGVLSLTGADTLADYQQVLASMTYADSSLSANTSARSIQFVISDSSGSSAPVDQSVSFDVAPKVVGVYFSGTGWNSGFMSLFTSSAGDLGPDGANQLTTILPWSTINTISVAFSGPVTVGQNSLTLNNSAGSVIASTSFSYSSSTDVAQWQFPVLGANKWWIGLSAGAVTDALGAQLDGAWDTGVSTFAAGSGTGAPGSDFDYRFNVVPGDANNSGSVTNGDVLLMKLQVGSPTNSANERYDINTSNTITNGDVLLAKLNVGSNINSFPDPVLPMSLIPITAAPISSADSKSAAMFTTNVPDQEVAAAAASMPGASVTMTAAPAAASSAVLLPADAGNAPTVDAAAPDSPPAQTAPVMVQTATIAIAPVITPSRAVAATAPPAATISTTAIASQETAASLSTALPPAGSSVGQALSFYPTARMVESFIPLVSPASGEQRRWPAPVPIEFERSVDAALAEPLALYRVRDLQWAASLRASGPLNPAR